MGLTWENSRRRLKFRQCISATSLLFPLGIGLNPDHPSDLWQVWSKLAQWFWKSRFLDFVNILRYFIIISPWKKACPIICKNWITFPKDDLCQVWMKLAPSFWRRIFFSSTYFCYFVIICPWKRGGGTFEQTPKDAFCQVWLKLAKWLWQGRFLKISSMHFHYFGIISPWKRSRPFNWTNLKDACTKFGLNWPCGCGINFLYILLMNFRYFVIISP